MNNARRYRTMAVYFVFAVSVHAQITARMQTRQTIIKVEAGADAPRLISLESPQLKIWSNSVSEHLIDSAEVDGRSVPLHWKLDKDASRVSTRSARFVYRTTSPNLSATWEWKVPSGIGPIEHSIHIENIDSREVWLPLQDSFCFKFAIDHKASLKLLYVDKGAGHPTEIGTHQVVLSGGYKWEGLSSTYARTEDTREIIPWFMMERSGSAHDGWYVGIEFSGRTRLAVSRGRSSVQGAAGLNPNPGPYRTRLSPNETFDAPTVFIGAFRGGADGLGNVLRPWIRQVLNNPTTWRNPEYPMLVNNTWGSKMDIDEASAQHMLRDAAELGLEMFHIDAGWYRGVGDWYPSPSKFPHGIAAIADEAHKLGLKFGIWTDWSQAGTDTEPGSLNVHDSKVRNWLAADVPNGWKPGAIAGRTIDLGFPPAKEYARGEVERIVTTYHLDMLEHDGYLVAKNCYRTNHPHAAVRQTTIVRGTGINMPDSSNSTDVSYHSVRAYYDIYSHLRKQHPDLMLEICNDGGRMVDFGSASHGDYFSITDSFDPLSNRQAFYDASHVLPTAMLEDYVEKWPTPLIENFRYMLRSGMMGWLTVMQDTNAWTQQQHAAAKEEFALYKSELRPLIRDADLYHISERPDGVHWDGIEYFDPKLGHGVIYAFRGTGQGEVQHTFVLHGLRPERRYRLRFQDRTSPNRSVSGRYLLNTGLTVKLPHPESSELVFLYEIESKDLTQSTGER